MPELQDWITGYSGSDAYRGRIAALPGNLMSPPDEVAMICALIERLDAPVAVEIGTSQGKTARVMAETMARRGGRLISIDPFGAGRAEKIVADWPQPCRDVTEFRHVYSMELFATLETETLKGRANGIGVVFVDGNHKFEYALFDIMEAADNLMPGGAIVVDNMEQHGPRFAALQFMRLNPAWRLYHRGGIWDAASAPDGFAAKATAALNWGVLISPGHLQVGIAGRKFSGQLPNPAAAIAALRLNLRDVRRLPVALTVNLQYVGWPHDFYLSGKGVVATRREVEVTLQPEENSRVAEFDPPLALRLDREDVNIRYELEMIIRNGGEYVLLDKDRPFEFVWAG